MSTITLSQYNINRINSGEGAPYVIETGETGEIGSTNGYQWYRLYSDGFMIQGGLFTYSSSSSSTYYFYKAFSFAPVVMKNYCASDNTTTLEYEQSIWDITASSFKTHNNTAQLRYFQYIACGY